MATGSDQIVGVLMMAVAAVVFAYYTLWVVVMPFVDDGHPLQSFFLPQIYAILVPAVAGVIALLGLGIFIGVVVLNSRKAQEKKTK